MKNSDSFEKTAVIWEIIVILSIWKTWKKRKGCIMMEEGESGWYGWNWVWLMCQGGYRIVWVVKKMEIVENAGDSDDLCVLYSVIIL